MALHSYRNGDPLADRHTTYLDAPYVMLSSHAGSKVKRLDSCIGMTCPVLRVNRPDEVHALSAGVAGLAADRVGHPSSFRTSASLPCQTGGRWRLRSGSAAMPRAAPPQGKDRQVRTTTPASDQHSAVRSAQHLVGIPAVFATSISSLVLFTCAERCRWGSIPASSRRPDRHPASSSAESTSSCSGSGTNPFGCTFPRLIMPAFEVRPIPSGWLQAAWSLRECAHQLASVGR